MPPIIKVSNLTHVYSPDTPFTRCALDGVNLEVQKGEFLGLIGHTGSGKSTLIQHFNGLLRPTAGQVLLDGEDIWQNPKEIRKVRFRVGLVFQYPEYQIFEETVYRDIAFGPHNMGLGEEEVRARVMEALAFAGLGEEMLEKSPFELSGGQKRRVAIAGVIAMRPDVLVLDEPTAGLDPVGRDEILGRIQNYHGGGERTVILVSHSMEEIARLASRIVVMRGAGILMSGTAREVFSRAPELLESGLDVPEVTQVLLRLRERGMDVDSSIYTVGQAAKHLLRVMGGAGRDS